MNEYDVACNVKCTDSVIQCKTCERKSPQIKTATAHKIFKSTYFKINDIIKCAAIQC